jgi:hypothetical protein
MIAPTEAAALRMIALMLVSLAVLILAFAVAFREVLTHPVEPPTQPDVDAFDVQWDVWDPAKDDR